ncbi:hypothetical protein Pst134EA_030274 [Puccinia striiformis f. sp. tritici]|uniref:BZIP domain-containing protein n=1 Tax=Puccinia striiformis f. sp. tritici PST-78 TaxID=1165861 RepID=A0A0L0V765_9BASI|nr:hypothetical protein Pst134EA_030274 [Puccinia striiformis f. sp. tritici]KAH9440186.1 hypothetical protein Pst134EB_030814 [Puccinia striiformis f. sp. tritici]KAH9446353.1 hypothetical protein Pst134EA_030274 [Puccinia striiformis f. sp. tritici]KAI9600321.1 hypothetical protein H4Q26_000100 [Puccinia striiformis f. sp. tritici PST-130]KNE95150.1 hypothetical protein PSTG_11517 [Puccinia striiformis f. sp. tritici PST-78]
MFSLEPNGLLAASSGRSEDVTMSPSNSPASSSAQFANVTGCFASSDVNGHLELKPKMISSNAVIPLVDLGSPSSEHPSTPKSPNFGTQAGVGHHAHGAHGLLPLNQLPEQPTKDTHRRKEQNRNAQRAFRERKEKRLQDLQCRVDKLIAKQQPLADENRCLKQLVHQLQVENQNLKAYKTAFNLVTSDNLVNSSSPLLAEIQAQFTTTFSVGTGYSKSTSQPQTSPPSQIVTDPHYNWDLCSQSSLSSPSSSGSHFPLQTPSGSSQAKPTLYTEYSDNTSALPPVFEGCGSDKTGSGQMSHFQKINYLEHGPPQPENTHFFGPASLAHGFLATSESPLSPHEPQQWYNGVNCSGPKWSST